MHAVVRQYAGGAALADALAGRTQEVEDLLRGVPGFVAYYAIRAGDGLTTITVADDQAGTEESSRRAAAWVKDNMTGTTVSPPDVAGGDVFIQFGR